MDDNSLMPFGEYKGKKMANVPDSYLLYAYDNFSLYGDLKKYIEENMDSIKATVDKEQEERKNRRGG